MFILTDVPVSLDPEQIHILDYCRYMAAQYGCLLPNNSGILILIIKKRMTSP